MDPKLATALLVVAVIVIILIVSLAVAGAFEESIAPAGKQADADEKRFREYVARELHKAQVGAANADVWAADLVDRWRDNQIN